MAEILQPPEFCRDMAIVGDDFVLAATASSLIGDVGEYVSAVQPPRMSRPDADNEVTRKLNGLGRLRPHKILLIGLPLDTERAVQERMNGSGLVIRNLDDLHAIFEANKSKLNGEMRCRRSDVGRALLRAKRERKMLIVDETAPPIDESVPEPVSENVVVVDDHDGMVQVIAANYAYSIGADLVLIPEPDESLLGTPSHGSRSLSDLKPLITPALSFGQRKLVTFITKGIPYGYFYRGAASTHLFSQPQLGETINAAIYWAMIEPAVCSAVLIDPGHFPQTETPVIGGILQSEGVCVLSVLKEHADIEKTRLFIQAFPYDLLFICSHCAEIPGQRLTVKMPDGNGVLHELEIDEAVQVGSLVYGNQPDHVQLHIVYQWASIDGKPWKDADEEIRGYFATLLSTMTPESRQDWQITDRKDIASVPHSTAIKLVDGWLMLNQMQMTDARMSPIIFNNGCVSFYEAAQTLIFSGARSYIGTLLPVNNGPAKNLAEAVFQNPMRLISLPVALAMAQARIFPNSDDRVYVHVGCHFCHLRTPMAFAHQLVQKRISIALESWRAQADKAEGPLKARTLEYVEFLTAMARKPRRNT